MGHQSIFVLSLMTILVIDSSYASSKIIPASFDRTQVLTDWYTLKWSCDFESNKITFLAEVITEGYVGFGIGTTGVMKGSDIVIGGVYENATTYFADRHSGGNLGHSIPPIDANQNWYLNYATETNGITTLEFSRDFQTVDEPDDINIADTMYVIYSCGLTDTLEHHDKRGATAIDLFAPPPSP